MPALAGVRGVSAQRTGRPPSSRASPRTSARSSSLAHALSTPYLLGEPRLSPSLPPLHALIHLLAPSPFGPSYSPVPSLPASSAPDPIPAKPPSPVLSLSLLLVI
eukprot:3411611-Rhodomonas_salina.1